MEIYMDSHVGIVRENNEDCGKIIKLSDDVHILVVADGMGGHKKGEVASCLATESIEQYFLENQEGFLKDLREARKDKTQDKKIYDYLKEAIGYANHKIFELSSTAEYRMMGTTVVLAITFEDRAFIANVGDSRCYHLKTTDEGTKLYLITKDNSLVQELIDMGELTEEEAQSHPQKNVITRAVGIDSILKIDLYSIEMQSKDILLLCSDGLSGMLRDIEIEKILKSKTSVAEKVKELIRKTLKNGGRDNVTVICAQMNEVEQWID